MTDDLPRIIVACLERLTTESVSAVKATIYDRLESAGIDTQRLIYDEQYAIAEDLNAQLSQRQATRRLLEERLATGRLTERQLAAVKRQIAALDVRLQHDRKQANAILRRLEHRPAPARAHSAPPPERLRHWGDEVSIVDRERDGTVLSAPRYELRWAIDRMSVALSAEDYAAATRLRETWAQRQAVPSTVNLNGAGGGVPGSRLPVRDRQLAAGREWNAIWHRLPPGPRTIVMNFICEEAPRGRTSPMTAVEFGQLYGSVKGAEAARGVTRGAIRVTCEELARLFRDYDQWRAEQARKAIGGQQR